MLQESAEMKIALWKLGSQHDEITVETLRIQNYNWARENRTHNLVRFFKVPKELGRSPVK